MSEVIKFSQKEVKIIIYKRKKQSMYNKKSQILTNEGQNNRCSLEIQNLIIEAS
jgi:hypothetical protein